MARSPRLNDANYTTSGRNSKGKSSAIKGAPKKTAPAAKKAAPAAKKAAPPKRAAVKATPKAAPTKAPVAQVKSSTKRPPTPVASKGTSKGLAGNPKLTIGNRLSQAADVFTKGGVARRNRRNAAASKNKGAGAAVDKMLKGMK